MSEMIERMARAEFEGKQPMTGHGSSLKWENLGPGARFNYICNARYVLERMLEPTEIICQALEDNENGGQTVVDRWGPAWRAAIEASLK